MGLLAILDINTSTVSWIFLNIVSGLGLGILWPACSFGAQAASSNADLPFAAAMFAFFRVLGQTIGVAIGGLIFQNELQAQLLTYPALAANANALSKDASALVQLLKAMPDDSIEKAQIIACFVEALRILWISLTAIAALGLFSSFFIKGLTLDRNLDTEQGFNHHHGAKKARDEEKNVNMEAVKSSLMISAQDVFSGAEKTSSVAKTSDTNDALGTGEPPDAEMESDATETSSIEKTPGAEGILAAAKPLDAKDVSGTLDTVDPEIPNAAIASTADETRILKE